MEDHSSHRIHAPSPNAFVFYCPKTERREEQVCSNEEARRILSMTALPPSKGMDPPPDFSSFCARWKEVLDRRLDEQSGPGRKKDVGASFVDLYQSRRRRYAVTGVVLLDHASGSEKPESHYLFMLERISPEGMNLQLISRQWKLSRREKEMVRLLLGDKSNKEIAHILGLSPHTVKGYLKLLMRRLGVSSRTGVIARLLTGRSPALAEGSSHHARRR